MPATDTDMIELFKNYYNKDNDLSLDYELEEIIDNLPVGKMADYLLGVFQEGYKERVRRLECELEITKLKWELRLVKNELFDLNENTSKKLTEIAEAKAVIKKLRDHISHKKPEIINDTIDAYDKMIASRNQ
tara:strand:+ start:390 stop:785 length:396 start_codon:yes stop_codon:yes gene_type:complete